MTPQPKSRTIGQWLVLDDHGDTWRVQCLACQRKQSFARSLIAGPVPPRCRCGVRALPAIPAPAKPKFCRYKTLPLKHNGTRTRPAKPLRSGETIGIFTLLVRADNNGKHPVWIARCVCGAVRAIQANNLHRATRCQCCRSACKVKD